MSAVGPIGLPRIGHAPSAVTAGTTNNRLLACNAPRCRINVNNNKGAPTPAITATQVKLAMARNVHGIVSEPANGAQRASTKVDTASSTEASEAGPAEIGNRPCNMVPLTRPTKPSNAHKRAATLGGRPSRSPSVTTTPSTPRQTPNHCRADKRSYRNAALIAATASGEEQAIAKNRSKCCQIRKRSRLGSPNRISLRAQHPMSETCFGRGNYARRCMQRQDQRSRQPRPRAKR
jgi:hypothetical protein